MSFRQAVEHIDQNCAYFVIGVKLPYQLQSLYTSGLSTVGDLN
jgi:hypothetical protein